MIIRKFKNGKILLKTEKSDFYIDGELTEEIYHHNMFMQDLYINQIKGYKYIVDNNTNRVYELESDLMENPLKYLLDTLTEKKKMCLKPVSKKESASLLQDLENGY